MGSATANALRATVRRGFALPLAILAIAMLTAAVAAGFAATASEAVQNNAQRAQERAYQIAEAGLQQFIVRRSESGFCSGCVTDPTATVDSEYTRVQLPGGYADIVAKRVWNPTNGSDNPVFFIRSRGVDTAASISVGGGAIIFAQRTVGVYARWPVTTMQVLSALTSLNGVTRPNDGGGEADVQRQDACNTLSDKANDLVVASGAGTSIAGTPALVVDATQSAATIGSSHAIDWSSILTGGITPDYTVPPDAWPASYTNWPVVRVKSNSAVMPTGTMQGLLIADSNLTVPKGATWRGVVLIGGRLLTQAADNGSSSRLDGAVVTGLNRLLPGAPPDAGASDNDELLSNRYTIRYYSCYVADAGNRIRAYQPMPNSWMDNVADW